MPFDQLLDACRTFSAAPSVSQLSGLLDQADMAPDEVDARRVSDPDKPYGRCVLLETDHVEAMMATWTARTWCAPHDHGGSIGGVRILRGKALHRIFKVTDQGLRQVKEETLEAGEILRCGSSLVHQMRALEDTLVTLHLYAGPIPFMNVYEDGTRYVVDGGCGAWVPHDQPDLLREVHAIG